MYAVLKRAEELFELSDVQAEALANSAGLSLQFEGGDLIETLGYNGKMRELCRKAMVSERMLRLYRHKTPAKQTIIALAVILGKSASETDTLLHKYGYCLSDSIVGDVVVKWYLTTEHSKMNEELLIFSINETLEKMGVSLLMTRQS